MVSIKSNVVKFKYKEIRNMEERIKARIKEVLGVDVTVEKMTAKKNNGVELVGYRISREGDQISPIIYEKDSLGEDENVENVVRTYKEEMKKSMEGNGILNILSDAEEIYKRVIPTVLDREKNANMFADSDIYHESYLDMEMVYRIVLDNLGNGTIGTTVLRKAMIEKADLDMNLLKQRAFENIEKNAYIMPLGSIVEELTGEEQKFIGPQPLVVSNNDKLYGAAAMMSESILERVHDMTGTDSLFILPSSIHEVIVIPANMYDDDEDEQKKIEELKMMVKGVNDNEVQPDEILTYSVYIHRRDGRMEVA